MEIAHNNKVLYTLKKHYVTKNTQCTIGIYSYQTAKQYLI